MDLDKLESEINEEILRVKHTISQESSVDAEDFDIRGRLYKLAFDVAPHARHQDLDYIKEWLKPQKGEKVIDIAAGTGFLTVPLANWTEGQIYAVDPAKVQLENLDKKKGNLPIKTIVGSLSDEDTFNKIDDIGDIDIVTSYGGIHHVLDIEGRNRQKEVFSNVSRVLKRGGRFIAGDVGENTPLSRHFESSVKKHCLTGHYEKWLNKERLQGELIEGTALRFVKTEIIPVKWEFKSEKQMALFMKALHAYDLTLEEILDDLKIVLGYEFEDGLYKLNWPMLFFHLVKG